jgi:hypothetical protein
MLMTMEVMIVIIMMIMIIFYKIGYAVDTTNSLLYKCVATCFDQVQGHPQATRTHKSRIKITGFILGQNKISVLLLQNS